MATCNPIETALLSGSRSKSFRLKIEKLCKTLPADPANLTDQQRAQIIRLAAASRSSKATVVAMSMNELPSIDEVPEFQDLMCETYYPVMEDGKRTVGFWSIKDSVTLSPMDVHEWVRDRQLDKKTGKHIIVPVPFSTYWNNHRPDYEIFGVASDRAQWNKKVIATEDRRCVNTMYDKPPVIIEKPAKYGDGTDAMFVLNAILERTIMDADPENAQLKRDRFVLDCGAHMLALRDFGSFRCCKIFCFTSTNAGQGTGKSFLHESIAALVPRNASCTVPTTELAGANLLALYGSSVCVLTEAPSTSNERYTAEDIKAFADAGWKTATEKYVAKRAVKDNSLKLLSSNHLAPLPIDNIRSRRVEYFVASENDDGGTELRKMIGVVEQKNKWDAEELRRCVGWALLERATAMIADGQIPCSVGRRVIDARHILSVSDYEYFVKNGGNQTDEYSQYKDFRTDMGFTWNPDRYKFNAGLDMSRSVDAWIDTAALCDESTPPACKIEEEVVHCIDDEHEDEESVVAPEYVFDGFQYKTRVKKAMLEPHTLTITNLYNRIVNDPELKKATDDVRAGLADKKLVLPQLFPGTVFNRFSRRQNITGFTGFAHVDFDHIAENGNGLTPEQVRDSLAELPGFVIGALSSRGNGAWGIFNAGKIENDSQYTAAQEAIRAIAEEKISMAADTGVFLPTVGRVIAHDSGCKFAEEVMFGGLPDPFEWKAPTFSVVREKLAPARMSEMTTDERVRQERFLEAVVKSSCERVQTACAGERHQAAVKAVANVTMTCRDRGMTPLSSWGRSLRDACISCGLPKGEVNDIMNYWKQQTGVRV